MQPQLRPSPRLLSIRQLRLNTAAALQRAYTYEDQALEKLSKADKLMTEAAIHLNNAKRTEELSNLRQHKLDEAYIHLNKSRLLIERRGAEQVEHDLFKRDTLSQM